MPAVHTIPAGTCFVKALAKWLLQTYESPEDLARTLVLLPTQRAILELGDALRGCLAPGQCLLLPQMVAIPDIESENPFLVPEIDRLPPAIPSWQRLGLMMHLVVKNIPGCKSSRALKLAQSLIRLIDDTHTAGVDLATIAAFGDRHDGLKIVTDHWPKALDGLGYMDRKARTHQSLLALANHWRNTPPSHPIIMADPLVMPALVTLGKTILDLPKGRIIAQGDDLEILQTLDPKAAPHYERIECATMAEEARTIALIMRYHLHTTTGVIALVTPNQSLRQRVESELTNFGLVASPSGGHPLEKSVVGRFLMAVCQFWEQQSAAGLLAILKHPLCFSSNAEQRYRHINNTRSLDKQFLRAQPFDLAALKGLLQPNLAEWFGEIQSILQPMIEFKSSTLRQLLETHQAACLALTGDATESSPLWGSSDGTTAKEFFDTLLEHAYTFPEILPRLYTAFFANLIQQAPPIHDRTDAEPRLKILEPSDVSFSMAEVIILGGLNENSWPPALDMDPWLNSAQRKYLGLSTPEQRLQRSKYEFCSGFYAPHLFLTRSQTDNGSGALPSRWWLHLGAVEKKNPHLFQDKKNIPWKLWAQNLERTSPPIKIDPPQPRPPVNARPRKFSATEVERLMRDPYAIYAKRCLLLFPLQDLDREPTAAERGQIIHYMLDLCIKDSHDKASLLRLAEPYFGRNAITKTFWWHRFGQIVDWFVAEMQQDTGMTYLTEQKGSVDFTIDDHAFTLSAIADRLDIMNNRCQRIVDYKTGYAPTLRDIEQGYAAQFAVESFIASRDGFGPYGPPQEIGIWQLKGGDPAGKITTLAVGDDFLNSAEAGLKTLLKTFLNPDVPYLACPDPDKSPAFNDYAHLERISEWKQ
ncbi:MAG: PD-(D/E)XK nuclease family protein [Alphaproteobacteria bacterium]|nr:PD-(D/E)XK nuclease family protein [Alphaproteobacteria bacterium]